MSHDHFLPSDQIRVQGNAIENALVLIRIWCSQVLHETYFVVLLGKLLILT